MKVQTQFSEDTWAENTHSITESNEVTSKMIHSLLITHLSFTFNDYSFFTSDNCN